MRVYIFLLGWVRLLAAADAAQLDGNGGIGSKLLPAEHKRPHIRGQISADTSIILSLYAERRTAKVSEPLEARRRFESPAVAAGLYTLKVKASGRVTRLESIEKRPPKFLIQLPTTPNGVEFSDALLRLADIDPAFCRRKVRQGGFHERRSMEHSRHSRLTLGVENAFNGIGAAQR